MLRTADEFFDKGELIKAHEIYSQVYGLAPKNFRAETGMITR